MYWDVSAALPSTGDKTIEDFCLRYRLISDKKSIVESIISYISLYLKQEFYSTTSESGGGGKADTWTYGETDDHKLLKRDNL